jgi:Tfp pilus assembly protein PilX
MMNKQPNSNLSLIQFMLRAQHIAQQDPRSEKGYAMMVISIISILIFSMLAAYMTITNITKSSTNAYIDGTNTFYAAESGLNKRAEQLRQKFIGYTSPAGLSPGQVTTTSVVTPANIINCFPLAATTTASITANDFECRNYSFRYNTSAVTFKNTSKEDLGGSSEVTNRNQTIDYMAYTFVADKTQYVPTSNPPAPAPQVVPAGQNFAGLNAQEYRYTVYSTAAKPDPTNISQPIRQGDAKTVLQMEFKSRIVPLFQFAVFYDGDLEMNSTSNMTIGGRVHTNSNFYIQPYTADPTISTTFLSPITAAGSIYNRIDAMVNPDLAFAGVIQVRPGSCLPLITGNGNCFPAYTSTSSDSLFSNPLDPSQINAFGGRVSDGAAGTVPLYVPEPGFLRKRNYFDNSIGEYYAKADIRLEMLPDRDVTDFTTTPWTRNTAIIPFNFTAIKTGGSGTCTTASPVAGTDPAINYIDPLRKNASTLKCNVLTKGQLQSLRQPVLVLTNLNQTNATLRTTEGTTLGKPTLPTTLPTLSVTTANNQILRALQVALVSTPSPIEFDRLDTAFSDPAYSAGSLNTFKTEFTRLIGNITTLSPGDRTNLLAASPNEIAALGGAWFRPAPIQRIESNNLQDTANNSRSSGFYDGREQRWISMLQTNIVSLSVWNRDGLYVEASTAATGTVPDSVLTTAYQTNNDMKDAAFNSGTGANFTDSFAFDRAVADATKPVGTLQYLGLGSIDTTEGGLVFYATVNDDLDGSGTIVAANDVTPDSTTPILKKKADGTNFLDSSGNTVTIDYPRKYRGAATATPRSPFGFAFNGGNYLPAPLTLVTDRAIYVQGDFNNNGAVQPAAAANTPDPNRLPASVIGDTITVLSNQCLNTSNSSLPTITNHLGVPAGQLNCGLPRAATGSVDVIVGGVTPDYYNVTGPTAVNAAFLSYTDRSNGNHGIGRGYTTGATAPTNRYSGGINNYMRMLENWGGAAGQFFNYSGSLVSLGNPLEYSGQYLSGGTYYNIPSRNFNFDTKFNAFNALPPLSPRAIYLQQDVFKRSYN